MTKDRFRSLDVIRGVALLGILLVNIRVFATPSAAYVNPTAWGDFAGLNLLAWMAVHLFAEAKFLSTFSMLFGAGVCLFADRLEARGERAAGRHYRRMFWLFAFGMVHAYLIWPGDVLVTYAICGSVVFVLRKKRPRTLLAGGAVLIALPTLLGLGTGLLLQSPAIPDDARAEVAAEWTPPQEDLEAEVAAWRGTFSERQAERASQALEMHTLVLPFFALWFCPGAMLIGMALYRLGIVQGERDDRFYRRLAAFGIAAGTPIIVAGMAWNFAGGWTWETSMFFGASFNSVGAPLVALGYVALIALAVRRGFLPGLQERLAAVGRMAFTNYIMHSVVCGAIFYGAGLGLFGQVERAAQLLVVGSVWILQLALSPIWLRRFRHGPLEWAWRALTYGRLPPFRTG